MIMKYIITESRLDDIFGKYMDSNFDLKYNPTTKVFWWGNGEPFGNIFEKHFYYADTTDKYLLRSMFGDNADKLMFAYIRKRFPNVRITGAEDYGLDEDKF